MKKKCLSVSVKKYLRNEGWKILGGYVNGILIFLGFDLLGQWPVLVDLHLCFLDFNHFDRNIKYKIMLNYFSTQKLDVVVVISQAAYGKVSFLWVGDINFLFFN